MPSSLEGRYSSTASMASLISLSVVSLPFTSSRRFLFKGGLRKRAAFSSLSIRKTSLKVTYFHEMCSSFEGRSQPNYSCHDDLVVSLNMCGEIIPYHLVESSCNRTTITGYWVGPDIDDGWGFIDALVDRTP